MPLFNWQCTKCGFQGRTISKERPTLKDCTLCGGTQRFCGLGPSSRVVDVIDTGSQVKPLEMLSGVKEMIVERGKEKKDDIV
jgi:hypothetical protein